MLSSPQCNEIFTIGHSTHTQQHFVSLLRHAGVTAIADVRTSPYSRRFPQFNREDLSKELRKFGISYVFLGKELGGRPRERGLYCEGVADYEMMAQTADFLRGLDRVLNGMKKHRIALMCSERDPLDCHRCLLVSRALVQRGMEVKHILDDGNAMGHEEIEHRLLKLSGRNTDDLFTPRAEQLATAYRERAKRVAFAEPNGNPRAQAAAGQLS